MISLLALLLVSLGTALAVYGYCYEEIKRGRRDGEIATRQAQWGLAQAAARWEREGRRLRHRIDLQAEVIECYEELLKRRGAEDAGTKEGQAEEGGGAPSASAGRSSSSG